MSDVRVKSGSQFLGYINSLGLLSSSNYESLRDIVGCGDDRKIIVELAKHFSETPLTDWYELTTQVYATWLFKNQGRNQRDFSAKPRRDSPGTNLSRSSTKRNHQPVVSHSMHLVNHSFVHDSLMKPKEINSSKVNCLVLQIDKLFKKRYLRGFYNLLYLVNLPGRSTHNLEKISQKQSERESAVKKTSKASSLIQAPTHMYHTTPKQIPKNPRETKEIKTPAVKKKLDSFILDNRLSSAKQSQSTINRKKCIRSGSLEFLSTTSPAFSVREQYSQSGKSGENLASPRFPQRKFKENSYEQSDKRSQELSFHRSPKREIQQCLDNKQLEGIFYRLDGDKRIKDRLDVVREGAREENEMKGCTFVPNVSFTHSRPKSKSKGRSDPYDRLYEDANRRTLNMEPKEQIPASGRSKKFSSESPDLKPIPSNHQTERAGGIVSTTDRTFGMTQRSIGELANKPSAEAFNKLYKDKDVRTRNLRKLQQKVKAERGETFSPDISKSSKSQINQSKEGVSVKENMNRLKSPKIV